MAPNERMARGRSMIREILERVAPNLRSIPIKSTTEGIVGSAAAWIEFDLTDDLGFQEWRGMLEEVGTEGRLFNGYILQTADIEISGTPVQLHVFSDSIYITPPFATEEYYMQLETEHLLVARTYFRIPPERENLTLEGYKPPLADMLAMDVWARVQESSAGKSEAVGPKPQWEAGAPTGSPQGSLAGMLRTANRDASRLSESRRQMIYTFFYEATIRTENREYHIRRFSLDNPHQ